MVVETYFHNRCIPRDIKSFIVSYEAATLLKTPATTKYPISTTQHSPILAGILPLASFSASATVSNPKCVVFSLFGDCVCDGESVLRALLDRHRFICEEGWKEGFAARRNGRMVDLDAIGTVVGTGDRQSSVGLSAGKLEVVIDIFLSLVA